MVATCGDGHAEGPSHRVLQETPLRVATFLRALCRSLELRAVLKAHGLNEEARAEGVRLLASSCLVATDDLDIEADARARSALTTLHDWARTHLARLHAAVCRLHPEHRDLFADLEFSDAATAAMALARWLQRVDALRETDPGDRAVLKTFAQRGVSPAVRVALTGKLQAAQSASFVESTPDEVDDIEALRALHAWFRDWSTTARLVVKRKDWLILLGLAERRRK